MHKDGDGMTTLSDLEKQLQNGNWKKAIKKADDILLHTPFEKGENRFSFMSRDAYCLYTMRNPDVQTVWIKNHSNVAYCKGYALNELKMYAEAQETLIYCLELDPVSTKIKTELFTSYVRQGKNDLAKQIITAAQKDILTPENACSVYAKTAFLLSCGRDFENAAALCVYSLLFGFSNAAVRELEYIEQQSGITPEYMPGDEEFTAYARQTGLALTQNGVILPFPVENLRVLKMLRGLYNAGRDADASEQYAEKIEKFEKCGFTAEE